MSDPGHASFFSPGGTLPPDAPSYIARQADEELYQSLLRGEFCYILTSRQMGKSSLMARTAVRLRAAGVTVAIIDLNAIGHDANLTPEQWYFSLLMQMGEQLNCEEELESFWQECNRPTPLQKWIAAIRYLLTLPNPPAPFPKGKGEISAPNFPLSRREAERLGEGDRGGEGGRGTRERVSPPSPVLGGGAGGGGQTQGLVIFIDEIDQVRALPFSTDEFFAAIRNSYNRRSTDPAFARLTFCLLGVALPSDLIRDPRLTPFNIGRRIELNDFTLEEALTLEPGLGCEEIVGEALLERVYSWTGGHPYLTQRLCQAIVEAPEVGTPQQVDALCDRLFLSSGAQEQDDNLVFVRDRLLRSLDDERDLASLLTLYDRIVAGKRVPDRKSDALVGVLRLSGIVRPMSSLLQVRNHIYERVFDRRWVREHMPDAELRRQRAAYFLGLLRAVAVSLVFLTVIGGLALYAFHQAAIARQQTKLTQEANAQTKRLLYAADMNVVQQAYEKGEYGRVAQLVEAHRPQPGDNEDLRGFEWRYYWSLIHQDQHTLIHPGKGIVFSVAFAPTKNILASANGDGTVVLWDTDTWQQMAVLPVQGDGIYSLAFSPNGRWLAAGCLDKTVRLWDVNARQKVTVLPGYKDEDNPVYNHSIAFSPDGKWLASGDHANELTLWDVASWHKKALRTKGSVSSVAFSPDGKWLASGGGAGAKIWQVSNWRLAAFLHTGALQSLAFSPDSHILAVGRYSNGNVELWSMSSRQKITTLYGHTATVNGIAFSPDGRYLATGSWDNTIRLWDVAAPKPKTVYTFIGHTNRVTSVAISRDWKWLASGGNNEVKVWNPWHQEKNPYKLYALPDDEQDYLSGPLIFSGSGTIQHIVSTKKYNALMLWDCARQKLLPLCQMPNIGPGAAFSPNGKLLAIGEMEEQGDEVVLGGNVVLWDTFLKKQVTILQVDKRSNHGVSAVTFSADGKILAVASGDPAQVTLWDTASGQQLSHFEHSNTAAGIAFSPDGKTLAAANWQGYVYLWDLGTKTLKVKWWAHAKPVNDVAFSPDGKTLATGSDDDTVKLWNVATQREMVTLTGPKDPINSVVFSPDGNQLAAWSDKDKKVWVWEAASLAEAKRAP